MTEPHKHADFIKAWADGAIIEARTEKDRPWRPVAFPTWQDHCEYRIRPEYPETSLDDEELLNTYHPDPLGTVQGLRRVANAAIAREMQDGRLFTESDVEDRAKRYAVRWQQGKNIIFGTTSGDVNVVLVNGNEWYPVAMLEKVARLTMDHCKELIEKQVAADPFNVRGRTIPGWITINDTIAAILERAKGSGA